MTTEREMAENVAHPTPAEAAAYLRSHAAAQRRMHGTCPPGDNVFEDAASLLETVAAERDALREALEPFTVRVPLTQPQLDTAMRNAMMATGYVHPVAHGEVTDLKTFALRCSRGMMALVTMRDANNDAEVPRQLPLDLTYYEERLAEAQARLAELASETEASRTARVEAEYQAALRRAEEFDTQETIEIERCRTMLVKVEAWQGAPDGLKEFMLEQLTTSIDRATSGYTAVNYVKRRDGELDWRNAIEAVGRAHGDIEREKALHKSRNAWLEQLWASLEGTSA